ncbi:MAG: hypothetical protein ACRBBS_02990 [Thalassovita sp.]
MIKAPREIVNERLAWGALIGVAALLQIFLSLNTPYPYVIESGDNGSILYIIARWLDGEAFAQDALLGIEGSTSFYQAALMWPNYLMGLMGLQLGLFYVIACFPMALAQMAGFYLLGKRLFDHRAIALALGLITLPVVYTLSGDLWGMYNSPLMRTGFAASLPWLLLLMIAARPRPYLLMLAAGLASYLHLPSGPPVALALLAVCFLRAGPSEGWMRASLHHILAGLFYLLIMSPYAVLYAQGFAAGDAKALDIYTGSPYANVSVALDQLMSLRGPNRMAILVGRVEGLAWVGALTKPLFAAIFLLGSLALCALSILAIGPARARIKAALDIRRNWVWVAGFFVLTIGIGVGLSALDQAIAAANGRGPVQLDLIRATRFIVPASYLGLFFALALLAPRRAAVVGITVITALVWLTAYPSTSHGLYRLTKGQSIQDRALADFGAFVLELKTRDDLDVLTPVLRYDYQSSALRYIGYLPLRFNRKDNNFITYSGTASAADHRALMDRIDAIRKARRRSDEQAPLIDSFLRDLGGRDMVIDRRIVLEEAEALLRANHGFSLVFERGDFALMRRVAP